MIQGGIPLRAGGSDNGGCARCGVCGDARLEDWECISRVEKAGVEGQWDLARVERRHGPGRGRN